MSDPVDAVLRALRLLARDITAGRPVLEARLLDAGGAVEEVAWSVETLRITAERAKDLRPQG